MKTKSKALLLSLCVILLAAASVFGTLAYLTDTKAVTNTFTVGKVGLTLDEAKVGDDGKALASGERVTKNSYHLVPGGKYDKDPTVTVLSNSDKSYVRAIVTVTFDNALADETLTMDLDGIVLGNDDNVWERAAKTVSDDKKVITYEYRYVGTVPATTSDKELPAVFTGIEIPSTWDNDDLEAVGNFEINVEAHAIQAAGFADADAAWKAFDGQQANN